LTSKIEELQKKLADGVNEVWQKKKFDIEMAKLRSEITTLKCQASVFGDFSSMAL
jgi:hypothetical protein